MQNSELTLLIVKLIFGGIAAFLAILLWSRTRDVAWMCVIVAMIASYAGIMYDLFLFLGMIENSILMIASFSIPIAEVLFILVPSALYIAAFVTMIIRNRH